jgi:hypothetical protein
LLINLTRDTTRCGPQFQGMDRIQGSRKKSFISGLIASVTTMAAAAAAAEATGSHGSRSRCTPTCGGVTHQVDEHVSNIRALHILRDAAPGIGFQTGLARAHHAQHGGEARAYRCLERPWPRALPAT